MRRASIVGLSALVVVLSCVLVLLVVRDRQQQSIRDERSRCTAEAGAILTNLEESKAALEKISKAILAEEHWEPKEARALIKNARAAIKKAGAAVPRLQKQDMGRVNENWAELMLKIRQIAAELDEGQQDFSRTMDLQSYVEDLEALFQWGVEKSNLWNGFIGRILTTVPTAGLLKDVDAELATADAALAEKDSRLTAIEQAIATTPAGEEGYDQVRKSLKVFRGQLDHLKQSLARLREVRGGAGKPPAA